MDGALTLREFLMGEPLPLATIHAAVLEFLQGREDAILFGAQAVNAYVETPRMTQDIDVLSSRSAELAEELRQHLADRFRIRVRTRTVAQGDGYRIYQLREPKNRHLVDIRGVSSMPEYRTIGGVRVVSPVELIAQKVSSFASRQRSAKGGTDLADLRRLLLAFPELKGPEGPVTERLGASSASAEVLDLWRDLAAQEIPPEDEDA